MRTFKRAGLFIPPFTFFWMRFVAGVVCVALLVSCCRGNDSSPLPPRTWTILAYLDGDNDLDNAALADLKEMEDAAASPYVTVIVQLDLRNDISAKRYWIQNNSSVLLEDLGELDSANPETLTSFLTWAKENYPADNTVLILWNHGNGWDRADGLDRSGQIKTAQAMFIDEDNDSSFLSNRMVREAIEHSGLQADLIGFDACTMGTIEALYEYSSIPGTKIIVTSQEAGESHGWEYTVILSALAADPGMSLETFASTIVDAYENFYETRFYPANPKYEKRHTISALRTDIVMELAEEVNFLAVNLLERLNDPAARDETISLIDAMRDNVQVIDPYIKPYVYIDLVHMDTLLGLDTDIASLVSRATVAEYHGAARENANGISIVFFKLPEAFEYRTYDPNYMDMDNDAQTGTGAGFINAYQWDEFLHQYYLYSGTLPGK
ncbi:MAG: clostripain-related cysteine peptidase [Desulfobacterales bacterium]